MIHNILTKKIIKDLVKILNKHKINYRVDIKNINHKRNNLYNKNIIISMNVEQNNK